MNDFSNMANTLSTMSMASTHQYPKYLDRWHSFRDILRQADTNVTLDDALKKVEMLYILINDGEK